MTKYYTMKLKITLYLFTLVLVCSNIWGQSLKVSEMKEVEIDELELDYSQNANMERKIHEDETQFQKDYNLLLKAKFKLINGDLKMADFYLNQINSQSTKFESIKIRYKALIKFIEGNFKEVISLLSDKRLAGSTNYTQVCMMKMLAYMATDKTKELIDEISLCKDLTDKYSRNDQFWIDILFKLKVRDFKGLDSSMLTNIESTLRDDEMSRLWLKAGLFLNREKEILALLSILPENSYSSKKIREIVALMYLRDGNKDQALMFVDDIDSANAENIKGNIYLQNKQYELAFGHFKLALQKKADSDNTLERAVPLAYLLNQFDDGIAMLNRVSNKNLDPRKKSALRAAFLIRLRKFEEAQDELLLLKNEFQNEPPFEVSIMDSYVNSIIGQSADKKKYDKRKGEEASEKACKAFDGISCWIALSHIHWENLGKTVKRDEEIIPHDDTSLDSLKKMQNIYPIKETPTVDQRDIEELDSEQVKILINN